MPSTNPSPPNPIEDQGTTEPHDDFDPSRWILAIAGFLFTVGLIWMAFVIFHPRVVTPPVGSNFPMQNSVNR